ncbi:hypothetical protein F4780DRAFT_743271 [Xylariomycetidae sp. FL0641]|nr:hypothetical protein F4780DRAFT_743271 [Xylariomycetidae sp. FL0641]
MDQSVSDARESRRLIRMYSNELESRLPQDGKARVLGDALIHTRWRSFFDPWEIPETGTDPITESIAVESTRLREKCLKFLDSCSARDRLDLSASEPSIKGTVELVNEVIAVAQSKNGRREKALKQFHRFCKGVDSHKSVLEIIPSGSEYVSIFAGTLNIVIKASVNHERIAEGLSDALCAISEHIVQCEAELDLFRTEAMVRLVADFYAHIFIFLSDAMDWIMEKRRKRLLDSFNENLYQKFEEQIDEIKSKSSRIREFAAHGSRAEVRVTRLIAENLARDRRVGLEGQARHQAQMVYMAEQMQRGLNEHQKERQEDRLLYRRLAERLDASLEDSGILWLRQMRAHYGELPPGFPHIKQLDHRDSLQIPRGGGGGVGAGGSRPGSPALPPSLARTSEEVLLESRHLEDFFHRERVRIPGDPLSPMPVTAESRHRLTGWMKDDSAQFLWLEGPPVAADGLANPLSLLLNRVIAVAEQVRVPVLSYFCELRRGEKLRETNNTREEQSSVALMCALLRQMLEYLPPKFESDADFSNARLHRLDGSILSWSEMIRLFRDLLPLMPDKLLCIVDGLHRLDDRSTNSCLAELLRAMRKSRLKVLLCTNGRSVPLRLELQRTEILTIRSMRPGDASWRF